MWAAASLNTQQAAPVLTTIGNEAAEPDAVLAAATGGVPIGPTGITIFFVIFVAMAIGMTVSHFKGRK
jgi:hypothetical protein